MVAGTDPIDDEDDGCGADEEAERTLLDYVREATEEDSTSEPVILAGPSTPTDPSEIE